MGAQEYSAWTFPDLRVLGDDGDLIAFGADLEPSTLIDAYRSGYFPMPLSEDDLGWFSPVARGVLLPGSLRVSRSLRRSMRRFRVTVDTEFAGVIRACADPERDFGWIDEQIVEAYTRLFQLGVAHSIEVWDDDGEQPLLVGGLYGVAINGLFAGESMFHHRTDASKVALVHLVEALGPEPDRLLDVQWLTPHLASVGCVEIHRVDYAERLTRALALPPPPTFAPGRDSGENAP